MRNKIIYSLLCFVILGCAIVLTLALILPPEALPVDSPATAFSAERAMQDLKVIAREPHPIGTSVAHTAVRDYILGEIRNLGLEPQLQKTIGTRIIRPGFVLSGSVENILVRLPGSDPDGAVLVMAHYDSSPGSSGALDDGTGTTMLLELLRNLQAGAGLVQDVIFLFTDGEESGSLGAYAFISEHPWFEHVRLAINLETFVAGPPVILASNEENGGWIKAISRGLPKPGFISLPYRLFGSSMTDAVAFLEADIPAINIEATSYTTDYHTNLDRISVVNISVLQHAGSQILVLIRNLGSQPDLELRAPDETFFPVLGRLVHYPNIWALPLAIVASVFFAGTFIYGFQKKALTWRGLGLGCLASLLSLASIVGISTLLWTGIQTLHPEYGYASNRVHVSDDILYVLGFILLAFAAATTSIVVIRRKANALDLAAGSLVIFWLLAPLAATLIPETSFLATWVLLTGSLALLLALIIRSFKHAVNWQGVIFLISSILATFLWVPVIFLSFISSGLFRAEILIGEVALWLGAMMPALDWITNPKRWLVPISSALVTLGFLFAGHFLVGKESPPPVVNPIGYWLDADNGKASWIAFSDFYPVADDRQTRLLVNPVRQPYTDLFPEAPSYSITTSVAPLLSLDGPHLEVIADEWIDAHREVTIYSTTSIHDRLNIYIENMHLLAIVFPNDVRIELPAYDGTWRVRFDGIPADGLEIRFESSNKGAARFLLLEETTGVPSFPGLETQPAPGTMRNPGGYNNLTDFTAIYRLIEVLTIVK